MKTNSKYHQIVSCLIAAATCSTIPSCSPVNPLFSNCDALAAAAAGSLVIASIPGMDSDVRTAAYITAPILGAFAFNCYRANERQKQEAQARAAQLQKTYVSRKGSSKPAPRFVAVPVTRDKTAERKAPPVDPRIKTKEVVIVDSQTGKVDPTVYEIKSSERNIKVNNQDVVVDV